MKKNKENAKKTSIMQAMEDLKRSGGNKDAVNILIQQMTEDEELQEIVEKRFRERLYPDKSLKWSKLQCEVEFSRFLSPNAVTILMMMCQNMRHGNLLQISQRKIAEICSVTSPKAVVKALNELIECGCIAVRIEGNTRRAPIYMVNPEISTIGTPIKKLGFIFWQYADKSETEGEGYKSPKDKWKNLTENRTYSKGYDKQEEGTRTVYFNKINEPNLKKKKKVKTSEESSHPEEALVAE